MFCELAAWGCRYQGFCTDHRNKIPLFVLPAVTEVTDSPTNIRDTDPDHFMPDRQLPSQNNSRLREIFSSILTADAIFKVQLYKARFMPQVELLFNHVEGKDHRRRDKNSISNLHFMMRSED